MATPEERGSPSNNAASSFGLGGAGGKFRKKPFRKQPTPYDRPPTTYRGTNNSGSTGSWMTRLLVEPASKIISYGANRFFASVFRKRLPPPPHQPPEVNINVNEEAQGAVLNDQGWIQEPTGGESNVPTNSRSNGISELEQLLKQKTFSRSEIDHLTRLLQSRAIEVHTQNDGQENEVAALDVERPEQFASSPVLKNRDEGTRNSADMSTHVFNSKVIEDDIATPAELAKAYMGSRPSKGSPSLLGIRQEGGIEDTGLPSNMPFTSKMPSTSLTKKTSVSLATPENGFITPRSRGRSAIYNMARTPYSRVQSTSIFKGNRNNNSGNTGPSMSSRTLLPVASEEKFESLPMTLKRRSSALGDEIGSIGSIRRTRQKSNLLAPKNLEITHSLAIGSHAKQELQWTGESSQKVLQSIGEAESGSIPITSHSHVPSKSNEVAAKIFQHLEKFSPKEKSSESKLVAAQERSPMKLMSGVVSTETLRSGEDVDSSKLLMSDWHDHKLGDSSVVTPRNTHDFSFQKQRSIEENGSKGSATSTGMWNPVIKNDSAGSLKDSMAATKLTYFVGENGAPQSPPKKRAFRMSAQEDSLELDDEVHANGLVPTLSSEKMATTEAPLTDSKTGPTEVPKLVKTTTPASEGATAVSLSVVSPFSVPTSGKPMESTSSPIFSFSPKVADKFPALPSESNKKTESGMESSSSLFNVSGSTGSQHKIPESDKSGHLSPPKAGDINSKSGTVPLAKGPPVSSSSPVSTVVASDHINLTSMGSGPVFTSGISSPVPTGISISTSAAFSGSIFGLSAKPSNSSELISKFGPTADPITSGPATSASKICDLPVVKTKADANPSSSSSSISNSSIAAPAAANSESSRIGSSSSPNQPTVNLQGSLFGMASKSVAFTAGTVSQSTSLPLLPSTSSPGTVSEGTSGLSSSSTSSVVFNMNGNACGSSFSNPQVLNPSYSFSSLASSSDTTSVVPASGPTSSLFKFGASTISDGNAASSSSASTSSIFSFGFGSSSASTGAAGSNSTATLPKFNFGSNSSAPVGSSSTSSPGIFNFGGNSSSSSSVNTVSSKTAANVFGSSWQSPASSIFSSSSTTLPSTGFSFGALSTLSAATNTAPMSFNSSAAASSSPFFSFASASASILSSPSLPTNQPVFGNTPTSAFGSSPGNNEQMNAEDTMAEDPVQSSAPSAPLVGQSSISPSAPGFTFGATVPSQPKPFMFSSQQNQGAPLNPSPFQGSGSLEFNAGGSFSLGSGDKSKRRTVKVNRNKQRKR